MNVPFHQYDFDDTEIQAVTDILRSGWLTLGPETTRFEADFVQYKGGGQAIGVNSCSSALMLMVNALKDRFPDRNEIILPVNTFFATASAVVHQGLTPVFCDIDPDNFLLSLNETEKKLSDRTLAVFAVHVGGLMPNMSSLLSILKNEVFLLEDCAHALESSFSGKPAGLWGIAGGFSFYPNKNITTGEGGMILTQDENFVHQCKLMRNHGIDYTSYDRSRLNTGFRQYDVIDFGYKFHMTDINAALGRVQLQKVNNFHKRRGEIVNFYDSFFGNYDFFCRPLVLPECISAHHLYIIRIRHEKINLTRDELILKLSKKGIQTSVHYKPLHLFKVFGGKKGDFPNAETYFENTLSLPLYPKLTDEQADYTAQTLVNLLCEHRKN